MSRIFFTVLLALSFLLSGCSGQQYMEHKPAQAIKKREVRWHEYSNTALVISTSAKRPALLYFTLDECPACKLMDEETFVDPEVVYMINTNFVPIKVNANQEKIVAKYGIDTYPTILILSSLKNSEIGKLTGARSGEEMMLYLKLAKRMDEALTMSDINILEDLLNLGG